MGGSTLFGHDPLKYIQKHVIPVSYGVKSHIIYNPSIHAGLEHRLLPHGTGFVIRDGYDAIVTPGKVVSLDESISRKYSPYTSDSRQVCIEIYSQDGGILLQDNLNPVCRIDIDLPDEYIGRPPSDNEISVKMDFGMAEILVKAIHNASGMYVEYRIVEN
jgi:hypothetical protein